MRGSSISIDMCTCTEYIGYEAYNCTNTWIAVTFSVEWNSMPVLSDLHKYLQCTEYEVRSVRVWVWVKACICILLAYMMHHPWHTYCTDTHTVQSTVLYRCRLWWSIPSITCYRAICTPKQIHTIPALPGSLLVSPRFFPRLARLF